MNNYIMFYTIIQIMLTFVLIGFAVFMIGFLIGYKNEDKKFLKKKNLSETTEIIESDKEKKAKKEWKKFLEYDGSAPTALD